jgi:hypothetical protein
VAPEKSDRKVTLAPAIGEPVESTTMPCRFPVVEDWLHSNAENSAIRTNRGTASV